MCGCNKNKRASTIQGGNTTTPGLSPSNPVIINAPGDE